MTRYGAQSGPDITCLGVLRDLADETTYFDADVVVVGGPFDGGTSQRPGTRFGSPGIPVTDIEKALGVLEAAVEKVAAPVRSRVVLGGDHSIAFPDARGVADVLRHGRVSMIHFDAHADTGDIAFGSLWGHGRRCAG